MPLLLRLRRLVLLLTALAAVAGCGGTASKADEETARNTLACQASGERIVVRFETDEARLLMPGGERVTLYQVPSGSGIRYTNGMMDLRGKGTDLQLARDGSALVPLTGCAPLAVPK